MSYYCHKILSWILSFVLKVLSFCASILCKEKRKKKGKKYLFFVRYLFLRFFFLMF